jgi:tetratricopeptide (TPR) repeat protein
MFEQAGDQHGLTEVYSAISMVEGIHCHMAAQAAALEQAAEHARRAGDVRRERRLRAFSCAPHCDGPTPVKEVLGMLSQYDTESWPLSGLHAKLRAMLGHFEEARELVKTAFERLAELGQQPSGRYGVAWQVETLAGDHLAAENAARSGCEELEQSGEVGWRSSLECSRAKSLYTVGRDDDAERAVALAEELSAADDVINQILVRQGIAKVLARRGAHRDAEQLAREAVAVAQQTDMLNTQGDALCDLAEVLVLAGLAQGAAKELENAAAIYEQKGNVVMARRTRSRLRKLRGMADSTHAL